MKTIRLILEKVDIQMPKPRDSYSYWRALLPDGEDLDLDFPEEDIDRLFEPGDARRMEWEISGRVVEGKDGE